MSSMPVHAHRGPIGPWCVAGAKNAALTATLVLLVPVATAGQVAVDRLELSISSTDQVFEVGVIEARNTSDEAIQGTVILEDWDRAETGGNRWYEPGTIPGACADRLEVFPRAFALDPGAAQSIRVSFLGDADLARECWGAVVLATTPPPVQGTGVTPVIRTAVKVYVRPAVARQALEVVGIEVNDEAHVTLENTGNVHLVGRATLQVRTPDNVVAHELELPPAYLLSGARGRVAVPMPGLAPGRYVLLAIADYGGAELAAAQVEHEVR